MDYTIEYFGGTPGADCTNALLKAINELGIAGGGDLVFSRGKSYRFDPECKFIVTKPYIKIKGGGTLIDVCFHVGQPAPVPIPPGFRSQEYCFVLEDLVCKSSTQGKLNLFEGENAAVVLLNELRVWNYDRVASVVPEDPAGTAPNNVTWFNLNKVHFSDVNYLLYTDKLDSQKLSCNEVTVSGCKGVARISHIRMRGIDGLGLVGNEFLFPGFAEKCDTKRSNIDIDYCQWVRINDNNLFEAGEDGIRLSHFATTTINGNTIGWCGQVSPGHGIHLLGGDLDGNNVCRSTVGNNTIEIPSCCGIYAEGMVGDVGMSDNKVYGAGDPRYYYGTNALADGPTYAIYCEDTTQNCNVTDNSTIDAEFYVGPYNYSSDNIDRNKNISKTWRGKYINTGSPTVSVKGCEYIKFNNPNPTTITNLIDGYPGQIINLHGMNNMTTIARNSNFSLPAYVVGLTIPTGGELTLQFIEGVWKTIGMSWIPGPRSKLIDFNTPLLDFNVCERAELQMPNPQTVSSITSGAEGRVITILALNDNVTMVNSAYIKLKGRVNTKIPVDGLMRLEWMKGGWREIYRDWE